MDLAASIQAVTEEIVLRLARSLRARDRQRRTSASPAAWRSTASPTARSCATGIFDDIWVQPAAGDAGGALGAALAAYHSSSASRASSTARLDGMEGAYLGPGFAQDEIERAPDRGRRAVHDAVDDDELIEQTAAGAGRRQGGRLVAGPHGVRAARARRPLDPGRPALARDAEDAQPQGQVPRELPPLRARRCCARTSATGSSSTPTAPTCCWSPTCSDDRRRADDARQSRRCSASTSSTCRARTSRP